MGWYQFAHSVELGLENFFERLARFTYRNTFLVFALSLVISLACGMGLGSMTSESSIDKLWVPENSRAKQKFDYIQATYETPKIDIDIIISAPDETSSILSKDYFDVMWEVDTLIRAINVTYEGTSYTYDDVCFQSDVYDGCESFGALNFWSNSKTSYQAAVTDQPSLEASLNIDKYPLDQQDVEFGYQTLGFSAVDASGDITSAKAIKAVWNLQTCGIGKSDCGSWEFQKKYLAEMSAYVLTKSSTANVVYLAGRSLDDELGAAIDADMPLVGMAYLIMIVFCCCSLGEGLRKGACGRRSSMALGGGAIFTVLMSTIAGYGIAAACGFWFTSLHTILPLLLVGIGIDDAYVIVNQFKLTRESLPLEDRVAATMRNCGMAIFYTSLTDFIAFFLGGTSSLKGISAFCQYAAISIFVDFILQVTMFVAILVWDQKRQLGNRIDCCCCFQLSDENVQIKKTRMTRSNTEYWFNKSDAKEITLKEVGGTNEFFGWLAYWLARNSKLVIGVFAVYWAISIWGCSEVTEGFDSKDLVLDSSHYNHYNTLNMKMELSTFNNMPPVGIYVEEVDYTRASVQKNIMELHSGIENFKYIKGPTDSWLDYFLDYLKTTDVCTSAPCDYSSNGVDLTDTEFQTHLAAFLASSDNKRFAGQIVLSDAGLVTNSRSWVFHTGVVKTTDQVKAMDLVNDFCDEWDGLTKKPWPNSWIYLYVFQFKIIAMELIMNFVLVLCAVGVISPIVLKQPKAVGILVLIILLIDTELFASIYFWGLKVNSLTTLGLVMAVGLVVDYNAHITHCFFMADPTLARVERLSVAMKTMGKSVLMGGVTTLLGITPMAFASCEIFRIFFKMFFSIIVFGLLHGLILGPTLLAVLPIPTPEVLVELHLKWRGGDDVESGSGEKGGGGGKVKGVDGEPMYENPPATQQELAVAGTVKDAQL